MQDGDDKLQDLNKHYKESRVDKNTSSICQLEASENVKINPKRMMNEVMLRKYETVYITHLKPYHPKVKYHIPAGKMYTIKLKAPLLKTQRTWSDTVVLDGSAGLPLMCGAVAINMMNVSFLTVATALSASIIKLKPNCSGSLSSSILLLNTMAAYTQGASGLCVFSELQFEHYNPDSPTESEKEIEEYEAPASEKKAKAAVPEPPATFKLLVVATPAPKSPALLIPWEAAGSQAVDEYQGDDDDPVDNVVYKKMYDRQDLMMLPRSSLLHCLTNTPLGFVLHIPLYLAFFTVLLASRSWPGQKWVQCGVGWPEGRLWHRFSMVLAGQVETGAAWYWQAIK
ncbi:hypothetical protein FIBSPDRAFT_897431 [Athelia psychrophila]|uniref:Uncharacterized protein n=1 Tax=Athelia psychrophila TaxID=1759441 RepID=A0A166C8B7_9AGAM|nr:hypothetical protein FIBSPDRAFT_897431 [Fibularhizoctonia sp. CBS 109695]